MHKKNIILFFILITLFFLCFYLSVFAGYKDIGTGMFQKLFCLCDDSDSIILTLLRLPRAMKAIIAGSGLALAGLFLQTVTKNPLAEPYITGISSGAGLGIVFSVLFFNSVNYPVFGFLGALAAAVFVILFAGLHKFSVTKLILVGLSINIFVSSLISMIILLNPQKSYSLLYILSGNITENTLLSERILFIIFTVVVLLCVLFVPKLNFLRLDEGIVFSSNKKRTFYIVSAIILSALLTSVSVFAAGIIGFVGIIVPLISKILAGQDFRYLFFVNILLGASFMLLADFLSRVILYPQQIPLGLVVAFIGAPVFVWFLVKKGDLLND